MARQTNFETQQRAEELLKEAIRMWKLSDKSSSLEGLEEDPIFQLIFNGVAYQSIELESDIAALKEELIHEFEEAVYVNECNHSIPATTVITTTPNVDVPSLHADENLEFFLHAENESFHFIPLLETELYPATIQSLNRLDSRRWLLSLSFRHPVTTLKGFAFCLKNVYFQDLKITMASNAQDLPLIAPWDYAALPLTKPFSLSTLMYNRAQSQGFGNRRNNLSPYYRNCAMDLLAGQNLKYFIIDKVSNWEPVTNIDLLLEFEGIDTTFNLTQDNFIINTLLLVNARKEQATLTEREPMARVSGTGFNLTKENQFLHLLPPADEQLLNESFLQVRRVFADRFNQGKLSKLLNELVNRYSSDYYAFQEFGSNGTDKLINQMRYSLLELQRRVALQKDRLLEGVYVILDRNYLDKYKKQDNGDELSLAVDYLLTAGASVNNYLSAQSTFENISVDVLRTRQLVDPVKGQDEDTQEQSDLLSSHYYATTQDVLVTPMDIKLFCIRELIRKFGITQEHILDIRIGHRQIDRGSYHTYVIMLDINLKDNVFTQRFFQGKIAGVEQYMQKMIEVRTNGLYSFRVKLNLK